MKKLIMFTAVILISGTMIFCQDKAEIKVTVIKDGKTVKDTTYTYDDLSKAKHALQMLDVISSEDCEHLQHGDMEMKMKEHDMQMKMKEHDMQMKMQQAQKEKEKKMMFISEDGELKKIDEDGTVTWITTSVNDEGDSVKVVKVITKGGDADVYKYQMDHDCKKKEFIHEDDEKVDVFVTTVKEGDNESKIIKKVKVVTEAEKGKGENWTVKESEDGEVLLINDEGKEIKLIKKESTDGKEEKWVSDSKTDEDVKVIVIKKKSGEGDNVEIEEEITITENSKKAEKKKNKK